MIRPMKTAPIVSSSATWTGDALPGVTEGEALGTEDDMRS